MLVWSLVNRCSAFRERLFLVILLVLVLSVVSCGDKKDAQPEAAAGPVVDSVASADGVMIHYEVQGTGSPALVFVHGWCTDGSYWADQVAAMKDEHQVVTLDLAGNGLSGANRTDWTVAAFGADVAAVVNKVNPEKIILVGHSMAGAVDIEAARLLGDRVLGLIGVDTYQNIGAQYGDQQKQMFLGGLQQDFAGFTRQFIGQMFPPDADSALVARVIDDMALCTPEVGIGAMKALFDFDGAAALTDMRKPIRAINADAYPTNVEANQQVAESFEVVYMPGHGHFLHLEDPQTFNGLLKTYVDELSH